MLGSVHEFVDPHVPGSRTALGVTAVMLDMAAAVGNRCGMRQKRATHESELPLPSPR